MDRKASIVKIYAESEPERRVDIILMNYSNFYHILEGYSEGLLHVISSEKAYNRKNQLGELGIHVQNTHISDSTADTAIENVMIRDEIRRCDFTGDLLKDIDQNELIILKEDILTLQMMRQEYNVVTAGVKALNRNDSKILFQHILGEKQIQELAEEEGIAYESAKQKLKRARKRLKMNVVPFMRKYL